MRYTKKENAKYKEIQLHLKVLDERTNRLKKLIRERKKKGRYNASDPKRILKEIKKAKMGISNAEFI